MVHFFVKIHQNSESGNFDIKAKLLSLLFIFGRIETAKSSLLHHYFNPYPLSHKSDWTLIPHCSVTLKSKVKVMRIKKKKIINFLKILIVRQILLVCTSGDVKRTVGRILISI